MRYGFNLKHEEFIKEINSNHLYTYNLVKNKSLITGDGNIVRYFYQKVAPTIVSGGISTYISQELKQSFLAHNSFKNAFVFYGITEMVNRGITRLITSSGIEVDGKYKSRIDNIFDKNNFIKQFSKAVSQVSGIGDVLLRIVYDPEIDAKTPIIEVIEAQNYELLIKRGFIVGYILKTRNEISGESYEMHEIVRKIKGVVTFEYKVYDKDAKEIDFRIMDNNKEKIIDLFGLKKLLEEKTFPKKTIPVKNIPLIYIANSKTNHGLRGIPDTEGFETIEGALSEVLSNMVDEIRKAGLKILVDEKVVPQNLDGSPGQFDDFNKTIVVTKTEGIEGDKLIQSIQGKLNTNEYLEASKYLIQIACNKAGVHPLTLGITGLESIAASAESQQEREGKTSLRKRNEMIEYYTNKIKDAIISALEMEDYINGDNGDYTYEDIEVQFGRYTNPNPESIVMLTQQKINAGIKSMKEAIQEEYKDADQVKIDTIYARVKSEKGMALTPYELELLNIPIEQMNQNGEGE